MPETAPAAKGSPATFDLREFAKPFDSVQLLPTRILLLLFSGLGAFLTVAGIGLAFTEFEVVGAATVAILLVLGAVILAVGAIYFPRASRAPIELQVTSDGLRLLRLDGRWYAILWSDYRNEIQIVDERGAPREQIVPSLRSIEFVFNAVNLPVQGPVPLQAVFAIMGSARSAGLVVTGWADSRLPASGAVDIKIRRAAS
jgi:hypothetical protein